MKKLLLVMLCATLGLALVACGQSSKIPEQTPDITGQIAEIIGEGETVQLRIVANDQNESSHTEAIANLSEETVIVLSDGSTEFSEQFLVGQTVSVYGNGIMTMSIPPQVPASVIVMLDQEPATVSNDGIASMLPEEGEGGPVADIPEAPHMEVAIIGTISEVSEEQGFPVLLVKATEDNETANNEMKIMVSADTVINDAETFYEVESYEFKVGEKISVQTNGITTRSIPPQATAMHIDLLEAAE